MSEFKPVMVIGTSARRRRQFAEHHFASSFDVVFVSPDVDEKGIRLPDPGDLTRAIATLKMEAVLKLVAANTELSERISKHSDSVAVTFDQVVLWEREIREKPISAEECRKFILSYSGSSVGTLQTTVIHCFATGEQRHQENTTRTYYGSIPVDVVEKVLARGECLHSAGGLIDEDEDMRRHRIRIDPGTDEEVQGFSANTIRELLQAVTTCGITLH